MFSNLEQGFVITEDGTILDIYALVDDEGDQVEALEDAAGLVVWFPEGGFLVVGIDEVCDISLLTVH